MKKIILAIIVAATAFGNAKAYDIFNSKANHSYFGIRASYELACPSDIDINAVDKKEIFGNSSGVSLGLIYNMPIWKNLYFEPGITLYYNTYSINKAHVSKELDEYSQLVHPSLNQQLALKEASLRQFGFRIPLMLGYHFDLIPSLRLSVFTGPEITLGLYAKNYYTLSGFDVAKEAYGKGGNLNRFDFKWRFGVGATFLDRYYAAISGSAGICDTYKGSYTMHSNIFDITLGYNF